MGYWKRPEGATKKSYAWVCSACGGTAYYVQTARDGRETRCGYAYCPNCGIRMETEPVRHEATCGNCKWRLKFEGVCINGESERRADFTLETDKCAHWEAFGT